MCLHNLMLLAKLDIKNKLVLIFQEGMNKKNEVKKIKRKKNRFLHHQLWASKLTLLPSRSWETYWPME